MYSYLAKLINVIIFFLERFPSSSEGIADLVPIRKSLEIPTRKDTFGLNKSLAMSIFPLFQ